MQKSELLLDAFMKHSIPFFILLLSACSEASEESHLRGYPVNLAFASEPVFLKSSAPTADAIEDYMSRMVPQWGSRPQAKAELVTAILMIADDFLIDARLLTAMIAHESAFDAEAVSPTGAVGLTQLTIPGLEEFLDQTGIIYENLGNKVYAGTGSEFFQAAIKKSWPTFPTGQVVKDFAARTAWAKQSKEQIFSHADQYLAQLIAGTTILKAAIAYCCLRNGACSIDAVREGLERYNGDNSIRKDGVVTKVQYAKDILRRVDQI